MNLHHTGAYSVAPVDPNAAAMNLHHNEAAEHDVNPNPAPVPQPTPDPVVDPNATPVPTPTPAPVDPNATPVDPA